MEPQADPDAIYVTAFNDSGKRVATALQHKGTGWTLFRYEGDNLVDNFDIAGDLRAALDFLRESGGTLLLAAPALMAPTFIDDFSNALMHSR